MSAGKLTFGRSFQVFLPCWSPSLTRQTLEMVVEEKLGLVVMVRGKEEEVNEDGVGGEAVKCLLQNKFMETVYFLKDVAE